MDQYQRVIKQTKLPFRSPLQPLPCVKKIIYHHMSRTDWNIYDVHEFHRKKGWNGIGYNYWIGMDGTIYEARGESVGAHTRGWNDQSIGIGFQGDYDIQQMPANQLESGAWLTAKFMGKYGLHDNDIIGHKEVSSETTCPGANFPIVEMKQRAVRMLNK